MKIHRNYYNFAKFNPKSKWHIKPFHERSWVVLCGRGSAHLMMNDSSEQPDGDICKECRIEYDRRNK